MKPSPAVTKALSRIAKIIPTWKIVPVAQDVVDAAFRLPETRKEVLNYYKLSILKYLTIDMLYNIRTVTLCLFKIQIRENPYCYKGRPRLKTAHELLRVSTDLENNLDKVRIL